MKANYFIGKICTILTKPVARQFTDEQFNDYFVGEIQEINNTTIIVKHPATGCLNCSYVANIIGIAEEQVIHPDTPENIELIQKIQQGNQLLDIDEIENLVKDNK